MAHQTLEKLAQDRQKLLDLVSTLSDDQLDRQHGDGWTVRETLTHLVNAEEDHCRVIAVVARGDGERLRERPFDLADHNQRRLSERGHLALPDILAALAAQRQRTEALYRSLSQEQLDMAGPHPALGEMPLGKIFRIIGLHERQHAQEIAAALRTEGV